MKKWLENNFITKWLKKKTIEWKNNQQIYSSLTTTAVAGTLFVLETYIQCEFNISVLLTSLGVVIKSSVVKVLIDILTHWLLFVMLYIGLKALIIKFFSWIWVKCHSETYIHGQWLHIHDKEGIRIGIMDVEQDFYDVSAEAVNMNPESNDDITTKWHYIGSAFFPLKNSSIRFMGCYIAHRKDEASKHGIHLFREYEYNGNRITKMKGEFGDALKLENGQYPKDATDKTGKITLYKMTDTMRKYLDYTCIDHFDETKLKTILRSEDENILKEPFVMDLRKVFCKNNIQKKWHSLRKGYFNDNLKTGVSAEEAERIMAVTLIYLVFADGNIDESELQNLRNITGFMWTKKQISEYRVKDENIIIEMVKQTLLNFGDERYFEEEYKEILKDSSGLIAFCNAQLDKSEGSFLEKLRNVLRTA